MENVYDTLKNRGFIDSCTHEDEIIEILGREKIAFYVGFDPTADSLHVGHYLVAMALSHMQRAGHTPILLMGGGTGLVGDPTDKTEMRRLMDNDEIDYNINAFKRQLSHFIDVSDGKAFIVNNADWLLNLKYLPFIREYGVHFSVNKMLTADAYKTRLEKGLSFFEFNYQLLQAYDFLELYRKHNCRLQMGGRDQWSNIIAGVELIRKTERANAYGITFTLLERSDSQKMGKTSKGAVWLDGTKTSPYEFFQYWRNVDDRDVTRFMKLLTYLSLDKIKEYEKLEGSDINSAKDVLAFEITKNVHGEPAAKDAQSAAKNLFTGSIGGEDSVPTTRLSAGDAKDGLNIILLLEKAGLISSRGEGRRLITQGGIKVNGENVTSIDKTYFEDDFAKDFLIQKGKKVYHRIKL